MQTRVKQRYAGKIKMWPQAKESGLMRMSCGLEQDVEKTLPKIA
jgi:hypothetical protein